MFPYTRLNEIFDYVNNHHYISAQKLSTILNITERTIRSDIQAINDVLEQHGACIKLKRKSGYYIEVYDEQLYREFLYAFLEHQSVSLNLDSSEERIKYVLNILLYQNDYISLDDLALSVYISRNTLQNYIKTIKSILEKYNLEYISKYHYGVKIIGNEEDKRKCLMDCVLSRNTHNYIIGFSKSEYALFEGINLDYIKNIVTKYLNNIEGITDDLNFKNLIIHFALMISRIQNDCYIHFHNLVIIPEDIKPFIDDICHDIEEHFHIMISEGEKKYMYLHTVSNTHFKSDNVNDIHIKQIIHDLLEMIYMDYNFDLRNDDILIKDLFNHFKSILTTKSYAINKRNPLLNTIKTNFPLSFEITFNVVSKIFNREPYVLTEDEIGYVSLHIGAAIERCFHGSIQRKNVLLVCGTGQATTRMLEARLDVFFNDKINIIHKMSYNTFCSLKPQDFKNIDFVISTIPLKSDFIPIITVNFALNSEDVEAVSKFLSTISLDIMKKSNKFFDEKLFLYLESVSSKEELLSQMCSLLQEQDLVDNDFYEKVLLRESMANTSLNDVFAIPHPIDSWSKQTKVVVAIIKQPLKWSEDTVQIVFLLAIKHGDQLDIEHLYDLFIEIVNSPKLQQEIIHSITFEHFLKSLHIYFKE